MTLARPLRLDPKDPAFYENRGSAFGATGDFDRAIEDLTEAIRLDATAALGFFNRGNAWRAKGDLDRAVKDFSQAIKLDPTDANALAARGGRRAAGGKYQQALDDYDSGPAARSQTDRGLQRPGVAARDLGRRAISRRFTGGRRRHEGLPA